MMLPKIGKLIQILIVSAKLKEKEVAHLFLQLLLSLDQLINQHPKREGPLDQGDIFHRQAEWSFSTLRLKT